MNGIDNKAKYIQSYNKEHYKQINIKISLELLERLSNLKTVYGSAPKVLEAGIDALEEIAKIKSELEKTKIELKLKDNKNIELTNEIRRMAQFRKSSEEDSSTIKEFLSQNKYGFLFGSFFTILLLCALSIGLF